MEYMQDKLRSLWDEMDKDSPRIDFMYSCLMAAFQPIAHMTHEQGHDQDEYVRRVNQLLDMTVPLAWEAKTAGHYVPNC